MDKRGTVVFWARRGNGTGLYGVAVAGRARHRGRFPREVIHGEERKLLVGVTTGSRMM